MASVLKNILAGLAALAIASTAHAKPKVDKTVVVDKECTGGACKSVRIGERRYMVMASVLKNILAGLAALAIASTAHAKPKVDKTVVVDKECTGGACKSVRIGVGPTGCLTLKNEDYEQVVTAIVTDADGQAIRVIPARGTWYIDKPLQPSAPKSAKTCMRKETFPGSYAVEYGRPQKPKPKPEPIFSF